MSGLARRTPRNESFNFKLEIEKEGAIDLKPTDWNVAYENSVKLFILESKLNKNSQVSVLSLGAIVVGMWSSQQFNAPSANQPENFHIYYKLISDAKKLNSERIADRFVPLNVDTKPIGVAEESKAKSDDKELEAIFYGLAKNWRDATGGYSLTMRRYAHASYQSILALEPKKGVISLILRELEQRPDRWFEALKALSKANPASDAKSFDETVQRWIQWGKSEKYIS
jgi:hypothetical protein